ncbi:uncharacterized protein LOC135503432 [Lineus longissimus]|uniref:uncharacterized protein LOC135503432 n=1 Tax=Lineus longissimus TaxID=88925 RepID=UPI00315C623E
MERPSSNKNKNLQDLLSTDELKILAYRNKVKNYGSLSREKLLEKLQHITNSFNDVEVKIEKNISQLSQIEKRVLAQRLGLNPRKYKKEQLENIIEEKIQKENLSNIKPKPVKPKISIRKPLLEKVKALGHKNYQNLNIEKLKELLTKEPVKRLLKSDLFKQAKEIGIDVKESMKKSLIKDLIEKHSELKTFKKVNSAFRGYVNHFQMEGLPKMGVEPYLEKIEPILQDKIKAETQHNSLKISIVLYISMQRKNEVQEFQLRTRYTVLFGQELDYPKLIEDMLKDLKNLVQKGSGWKLIEVIKIELHTINYTPLSGSSYIPLPDKIQNKKAVINVQNSDQKCFRYSVEAYILNLEKNTERVSNYNKPEFDHMFKDLEYPVTLKDIDKFEKNNPDIAVNVFTFIPRQKVIGDFETVVYPIFPVRISERILSEDKYINLLHYKENDNMIDECEKIEDIQDNANYHYTWIKNFSRLVSTSHSKQKAAVKVCFRCMKVISASTSELLDKMYHEHLENCVQFECVKVSMPSDENNILLFTNLKAQQKHPVVIIADFESSLKTIDKQLGEKTVQNQQHIPNSYAIYIQYDQSQIARKNKMFTYIQQAEDEDIGEHFANTVTSICSQIGKKFLLNPKPMDALTHEQQTSYNYARNCYLCDKMFTEKYFKVRDHNHFTGKYRGAACNNCNLQFQTPKFIPVYFHNLSGYDAHLFVKNLKGRLNVIASNSENYISFSKVLPINDDEQIEIRFLDSYRLMQSSLANLAKNLPNQQMKNLAKKFNGEHFDLVTRKGVYPYEWVDSYEKFQSQQLPSIEEFYSTFNSTKISQEEYLHAQHVWDRFNCQTFEDYHKIYLETDVLLLADIIENFRQTCMDIYNLDPAFFYTSPGLSWQAMLKMTKVKIELLTDVDMYNFFELGIRGGICQASHRYGKANNPYLENFDSEKPTSYITYVDANNLYGVAMGQDLPVRKFKWMKDFSKWRQIPCTLEVDLEYPKHLHNLHNDYPLAPEHKNDKLIPNLQDKKNYIVHHKALKFYLSQGLKLKKIHRGISYEESNFLKEYIDLNTSQRANAKNDFEKDFFKLMNNAIFGKTMESVRRRKDITLATTVNQLRNLVNSNNYRSHKIFCKDLVMVERQKAEVYLNKPIFMGQAILDLSKEHMYDFHYSHMMKKYGDKAQLLYTDTDSLVYNIQTDDIYKDMQKDAHLYDFSNFPKDHALFSEANKKVIGKFKDEEAGHVITEFIALRSKLYSYTTDKDDEVKKCKGIKKNVVKNEISFEDYKQVLLEKIPIEKSMNVFRSRNHQLYTEKVSKVALDAMDTKRQILEDGISTLALGHYDIVNK